MKVLVTGSEGFIGKNLMVRFGELAGYEVTGFDRGILWKILRSGWGRQMQLSIWRVLIAPRM